MKPAHLRYLQHVAIFGLAGAVFLLVIVWTGDARPAYALPEYAERTGEPCATCHVNPGGGGPRTLRGLLWAAHGNPDVVPELAGVLVAPGVSDPAELYEVACAACHGARGEGIFGRELTSTALRAGKIRTAILSGRTRSGMPAFEGQFTDAQLEALVTYVAGLASGEIAPAPESYLLPLGEFACSPAAPAARCGGN